MVKEIPLTRGKTALVDDADYEWLSKHKWYCTASGYAARREYISLNPRASRVIYMHKVILGGLPSIKGDHIDGDKMNNTRQNLRFVTDSQSAYNTSKGKNNTSGYKGVIWAKWANLWRAQIMHNRKSIRIGYFKTKEAAAQAYNQKALELFGQHARLNIL